MVHISTKHAQGVYVNDYRKWSCEREKRPLSVDGLGEDGFAGVYGGLGECGMGVDCISYIFNLQTRPFGYGELMDKFCGHVAKNMNA